MTTQIESMQKERIAQTGTLKKLLWVTSLAILATSVANLVLYFVAGTIFPSVDSWPGAGAGQIVGATIVYLTIGAIVLAIIARISSKPARHFRIVATIGLLLSMFLPLSAWLGYGAPGTSAPNAITTITLSLMHVVAYVISVPLFIRLGLSK